MKLKLLVAAVALAASAQASASILATNDASGTNEAFLSAWDSVTNTSYTQDLGISFNELYNNMSNTSYSITQGVDAAVWTHAFGSANLSDIQWNVAVGNAYNSAFSNAFTNYGVMGTSLVPTSFANGLNGAIDKVRQEAVAVNTVGDGQANTSANIAVYGDASGGYAGTGYWGYNYGNTFPGNNTAGLGVDLNFYHYGNDANYAENVTQAVGTWSFDGNTIHYGAAVSTVPVPAAIWLMGSGLIGMVGIARRKKHSV